MLIWRIQGLCAFSCPAYQEPRSIRKITSFILCGARGWEEMSVRVESRGNPLNDCYVDEPT